MTRLLLLAVIAYLVWLGIESLLDRLRALGAGPRPPRASQPGGADAVTLSLVRCAGCGTHLPRSRALSGGGGEPFCSEECRRRAAASA